MATILTQDDEVCDLPEDDAGKVGLAFCNPETAGIQAPKYIDCYMGDESGLEKRKIKNSELLSLTNLNIIPQWGYPSTCVC